LGEKENIKLVRTVCPAHCGVDSCGILAHVKGDRIIKLEPGEFPFKIDNRICLRGLSSLDLSEYLGMRLLILSLTILKKLRISMVGDQLDGF